VSQDSTKPPGWVLDDEFNPVKAADVSDLAGLPRRFDAFAAEIRTALELLTTQLLPAINRINDRLDDDAIRLNRIEKKHNDLDQRVAALEQRAKQQRKRK
jgi:hypothetical protein